MSRKLNRGQCRFYIAPAVVNNEANEPEAPTHGGAYPFSTNVVELAYPIAPGAYLGVDRLAPDAVITGEVFVLSIPYDCHGCREGKCVVCDDHHPMRVEQIAYENTRVRAYNKDLSKLNARLRGEGKPEREAAVEITKIEHAWDVCPACAGTSVCANCGGTRRTIIPANWPRATRNARNQWVVQDG